jgi:GAF domain-containing protein
VRGEIIGALGLQEAYEETGHVWSDEDIALIETVADQVGQALEAARLYNEAQRRAHREQLVTDITGKIRSAPDIEGILRVAVQEIRRGLGVSHGVIRLGTETHLRPPTKSAFETEVLESEGGAPE